MVFIDSKGRPCPRVSSSPSQNEKNRNKSVHCYKYDFISIFQLKLNKSYSDFLMQYFLLP